MCHAAPIGALLDPLQNRDSVATSTDGELLNAWMYATYVCYARISLRGLTCPPSPQRWALHPYSSGHTNRENLAPGDRELHLFWRVAETRVWGVFATAFAPSQFGSYVTSPFKPLASP